jgi:Tol biopolymer transport system component
MSPQQSIAHYRILSKLGEGGMGAVYRATDAKLNRDVAIKVLPDAFAGDPDRLDRFTREAQVLASMNHPNIAAIYGVEERALVMELVEGSTLAERIAIGPIPPDEALTIARQIAEALEYAHERGIIHRDLKPANIKITPEGRVKVLDFGLAKALGNDPAADDPASSPTLTMRATMAGVIMGTAAYMSPEQAKGKPADRRADIWAFGVVLAEMLTGRLLYTGETVSETLAAVLLKEPDFAGLPQIPATLRRLLDRCLNKDPQRRLRDIGEARIAIEDLLAGGTEPEAPPGPAVAAPPRRAVLPWAAASILALAGAALAFVHFRETPPEAVPVVFHVPAPQGGDFGNGGLALSPDGRRLVFVANDSTGHSMLWLRSLDSAESHPIPGTEGGIYLPFWSPDGRFIGFPMQGVLKTVDTAGGPPQKLCEVSGAILGGSWSREGVILFGTNTGGLYRVSQAGGVPGKVTEADTSAGEIGHLRPWFFPDGRHFLYVTRMRNNEGDAIWLASLDSKERKRLVTSRQTGAYVPPVPPAERGHLLYLQETTLMAQPMDPRRLELVGDPFPIADQVGSALALGYFAASANGVLAFRSGGTSGFSLSQLKWFDRGGKSLGNVGPPAPYTGSLALSPDGARVATEQTDNAGNRDIWIVDVARGVPTRFTFDPGMDLSPVWSPDGTRIAFRSARGKVEGAGMYQKLSNGSAPEELLLADTDSPTPTAWSPDGQRILFNAVGVKTLLDLSLMPVTPSSGKPVFYLQSPFTEFQGQFSPDGRWIAYTSDESQGGQFHVFVQSNPIGAGKFQVSTGTGGSQPRWRHDGKEIFYVAADGKIMAVDVKTAPRFEAGAPHTLFDPHALPITNHGPFRYDVASDGKRFIVDTLDNGGQTAGPITVVLNWAARGRR